MHHAFRLVPVVLVLALLLVPVARGDGDDPLPSWADGPVKKNIITFVSSITVEGGSRYVPLAERIAVFDNDGTLWCEQPVVQIAFVLHEIKKRAAEHPEWRTTQPFQAALEGDVAYLENDYHNGAKGLMTLLAATHIGMTQEAFATSVRDFFETARHPKLDRRFDELAYQPMLELLAYLRENGFETHIVSGGGIHFMRVVTEQVYGIPPQNVVGSHGKTVFETDGGRVRLEREGGDIVVNDREGKPVGIDLHIGRVPIFAAGNVRSGGDIAMLTYCRSNRRPTLQLLINHDDAEREYAYAEKDNASLDAAKRQGWQVVNIKKDWTTIFPSSDSSR